MRQLWLYRKMRSKGLVRFPLVIIGKKDKSYPNSHQELAALESSEDILYIPRVDFTELPTFYNQARALIHPSLYEGFGLTLLESMACGTPVIGVNSGGPRDFVTDEVGGLVPECEGNDLVNALLATIRKALTEDWKGTKGHTAANYVREHFSVDQQCQNLLSSVLS